MLYAPKHFQIFSMLRHTLLAFPKTGNARIASSFQLSLFITASGAGASVIFP